MSDAPSAAVPISFGRYRVQELLAVGGMAEVYRAELPREGKRPLSVVIKRVKRDYARDNAFVRMLVDEAKLSATLVHPNIVRLYEFGRTKGHAYIAMEYIEGLNLHGMQVQQHKRYATPLYWQPVLLILRDMLRGLDYAHHMTDPQGQPLGLIHRDINPVNVMVRVDGAVKLLDFGIAKAAEGIRAQETVAGVLKGKFGYMSPEQSEAGELDGRSDVFSASIVMFELLSGRRLFWAPTELEVLQAVRQRPIPDPRAFAPKIPGSVVAVMNRGLERSLAARWRTAGEMADALDAIIAAEGIAPVQLESLIRGLMHGVAPVREGDGGRKVTRSFWRGSARPRTSQQSSVAAGTIGGDERDAAPSAPALADADAEAPSAARVRPATSAPWRLADAAMGDQPTGGGDAPTVLLGEAGDAQDTLLLDEASGDDQPTLLLGADADEQHTLLEGGDGTVPGGILHDLDTMILDED